MTRITGNHVVWRRPLATVVTIAALGALSVAAAERAGPAQLGGISPVGRDDRVVVRHIPIGTAAITGTVTAGDTGRPLADVVVAVSGTVDTARGGGPPLVPRAGVPAGVGSSFTRTVVTDGSGRFVVDRLPPGRYQVTASAARGFLSASHGQRAPGAPGAWMRLRDGERVDIALPLVRLAAIVGTVFRNGEPLSGAYVQAFRFDWSNGVRRLMPNMGAAVDDRGVYRISNLQPGEYAVAATPSFNPMIDRARLEAAAFDAAVQASVGRFRLSRAASPGQRRARWTLHDRGCGPRPVHVPRPGTSAVGRGRWCRCPRLSAGGLWRQ